MLHEPGKFLFYYGALHYYTRIFGLSEIALRSMSVVLSLATLVLVFALGREMFDESTALAAAAMWAFNPLAVVFAHTARMYPMLIALALAHLLMLLRVRSRPGVGSARGLRDSRRRAALYAHGAASCSSSVRRPRCCCAIMARGRRDVDGVDGADFRRCLFVPYLPYAHSTEPAQ